MTDLSKNNNSSSETETGKTDTESSSGLSSERGQAGVDSLGQEVLSLAKDLEVSRETLEKIVEYKTLYPKTK